MKNIAKIIRTVSAGAALAVVFTLAFTAAPGQAHASYGYGGYGGYGGHDGYSYSYSKPYYYQNRNTYSYPVYYPVPQPVPQPIPVPVPVPQPVPTPVYSYNYPTYTQPAYYPLTVSCYPSTSSVSAGTSVTWQAYASGGTGSYTYSWTGIQNSGSAYNYGSQTAYSIYYTPGSYSASVTVYSDGQSATRSCGYVTVTGSYNYNYVQPTYVQPVVQTIPAPILPASSSGNLVAACFADRTAAQVGTPVKWAVEVTGGTGQYAYQWSGTDGLSGTGASAVQSYDAAGAKNASVLITSGGQTTSQACGDSVKVTAYAPANPNYQGVPAQNGTNGNSLSAAALFSLANIPWGWIAILIIIILFVAVFYLLFNRHKV